MVTRYGNHGNQFWQSWQPRKSQKINIAIDIERNINKCEDIFIEINKCEDIFIEMHAKPLTFYVYNNIYNSSDICSN